MHNPVTRTYWTRTLTALLVLLSLALVVNLAATFLTIHDHYLLNKWLVSPAPPTPAEIVDLQRELIVRVVTRLTVSAVLVLSAIGLVWQRRRNLSIHGAFYRVQRLAHDVLVSMAQGVVVLDGDGTIVEINPAAVRLLGPVLADGSGGLVGRPIADFPAALDLLKQFVEQVVARGDPVWDRDLTIDHGGLKRRLRADLQATKDEAGRPSGCVILLRDMTMGLLTEDRMRRMERIVGLGDAATGLVHEIKNPLTALSIHIQLLEEHLADPAASEPAAPLMEVLKAQADRLNNVLDGFSDYAQLQALSVQPTDAAAVLGRIVQLIRPQALRQGVRVEIELPVAPFPEVPLDAEKFEQAVLNLTINSLEAMPHGGALIVSAGIRNGALLIKVSDTGPGIPLEIRDHIFKPYFSTKSRGTGLGLALAEKMVGQHRGEIDCQTGPAGTSFQLSFPLDQPRAMTANHELQPVSNPDRG